MYMRPSKSVPFKKEGGALGRMQTLSWASLSDVLVMVAARGPVHSEASQIPVHSLTPVTLETPLLDLLVGFQQTDIQSEQLRAPSAYFLVGFQLFQVSS